MSAEKNCSEGAQMPEIWAVIVGIILLMIIYAWISSKMKARRKRKVRESTVPYVTENLSTGKKYNVHLNDGRKFDAIEIVGSSQPEEGQFSFTGWEEMLILKNVNNKRIFLKQSSIRFIEEI
jgi:hypothetical protein